MNTANPTRIIRKMSVTKIVDHTPMIRELFIDCKDPSEFSFKAGQFVMLHVPQGSTQQPAKPALRAYSIASTDLNSRGFRLIFKSVENGLASRYIWNLHEGADLDFTGPFGRVFFKEPPTPQVIFLNTGSGVSQHFSFLESNIEKYPAVNYRLLFGVRREADIYYEHELMRLKARLPNFEYAYVLSRSSESWKGLRGYVQDHISSFNYKSVESTFYLCGNGAMIKDVKQILSANEFDMTRVWTEAFD